MLIKLKKTLSETEKNPEAYKKRVLVTGAAGHIGSRFAEAMKDYYKLSLMIDRDSGEETDRLRGYGDVHVAKLENLDRLKELFAGVDTILHLAGEPSAFAVWKDLKRDNVEGTYNVLAAAKSAGCRRVVFASSVHAVSAYPLESQVKTHEPVNPGDLYGVTKVFGEALGRYMAERENLSFIAIRIGGFAPLDDFKSAKPGTWMRIWVAPPDLIQLFRRAIDDDKLQFAIFNGVSNNRIKYLDISDARELLGYEPEHDAYHEHPELPKEKIPNVPADPGEIDPSDSGLREDI